MRIIVHQKKPINNKNHGSNAGNSQFSLVQNQFCELSCLLFHQDSSSKTREPFVVFIWCFETRDFPQLVFLQEEKFLQRQAEAQKIIAQELGNPWPVHGRQPIQSTFLLVKPYDDSRMITLFLKGFPNSCCLSGFLWLDMSAMRNSWDFLFLHI